MLNKNKSVRLFLLLFLISGIVFHVEGTPLKTLKKFHAKETSPLETLIKFHPRSDDAHPERELHPRSDDARPEREILPTKLPSPLLELDTPLWIGHNFERQSSLSVLYSQKLIWLKGEMQFLEATARQLPFIGEKFTSLRLLDPTVAFGVLTPLNKTHPNFYVSVKSSIKMVKHHLTLKALLETKDYKALLQVPSGRLILYYFTSRAGLLKTWDIWHFYFGWSSPPLTLDFSNIEAFTSRFKGLRGQSESVLAGAHWNPNIDSSFATGLEFSLESVMLSLWYKI